MLLEIAKGAVLILTQSEWAGVQDRDIVINKNALVVTCPNDSTLKERVEAYRALREAKNA